MFYKKYTDDKIPGNYQYNAITCGPISQRLWHLSKQDLIETIISNETYSKICDAGCGSGVIANKVNELLPSAAIYAYDIEGDCIEFASEFYKDKTNIIFKKCNLLDINTIEERNFDLIFSMEVVEHLSLDKVNEYLNCLYELGTNSTKYIITTPDYESFWPLIELMLDGLSLAPKLEGSQHLTKFTKKKLARIIEEGGFKVTKIYNFCGLSPFVAHVSLSISEYISKFEKKKKWGNLICCEFERL